MISPARSILATIFGAVFLTIGMVFMLPSQVEVQANPLDGFERMATQIKDHFAQLKGATNGTLCADNEGLRLIRGRVDRYENLGTRTVAKTDQGGTVPLENYHLTTRLIACMVSPVVGDGASDKPGYVIFYGKRLVTAVSAKFIEILSALALLATVLLGIRLVLGYAHELQSGSFMLLLKIGFVYVALSSMPMLYESVINTMNSMSGSVAKAIPTDLCPEVSRNVGRFVSGGQDRTFLLPWVKLDCAIESIANIILDSANTMVGTMVTALFSNGMGKGLGVAFFATLFTLFNTLNLAVFIVVLANLALVLMFMIAPLCWVCVLFKPTMKYFQKWVTLTIGFALQPVLLALFLMMMITAFEQVICKGSFSVVASFNAIKNNHVIEETLRDSNNQVVMDANGRPVTVSRANPSASDYGARWCTRTQIQKATEKMVDINMNKSLGIDVVRASPEVSTTESFYDRAKGILMDAAGDLVDERVLRALISSEGFEMATWDLPQIKADYVKRLGIPFQSMLAAFAVIFILYAFLKQLPNFINQLASASVTSGNLNQLRLHTAAKEGMKSMDAMTSDFNVGAMQQYGAARTSTVAGMRDLAGGPKKGGSE